MNGLGLPTCVNPPPTKSLSAGSSAILRTAELVDVTKVVSRVPSVLSRAMLFFGVPL